MTNQAGRSARRQAARIRGTRPATTVRERALVLAISVVACCTATGLIWPGYGLAGLLPGVVGAALFVSMRAGDLGSASDAARRWEAGARGEEATERILRSLAAKGWTILHDRAIPGSAANLDHLAVGPAGQVVLIDSKQWSGKNGAAVSRRGGRLVCGGYDRQKSVETLLWEAQRVQEELGVPVTAVMVVHGAKVAGGSLRAGSVHVVGPGGLVGAVASAPRGAEVAGVLARRAQVSFPSYT
ncbi:nuclease-related domain-containing protein [Kitasatospora sp. NPDC056731]|uniref:nuclease-related domain-containing protein n=1 Tax=Kitasatospora sp. NPDC056731 TaxID=3155422 RepID=UPI003418BCE7